MILKADNKLTLELTAQRHADALFQSVDKNRKHLSTFLPWVGDMNSVSDFNAYIKNCEQLYEEKKELSFVIISDKNTVGRIGLNNINLQNKNASIGYWLTKDAEGKGIITRSCKKLVTVGFKQLGMHRIEIRAAVNNLRSRAIPQKLNFREEGILREAELVNGTFLDLVLYSMLSEEWKE